MEFKEKYEQKIRLCTVAPEHVARMREIDKRIGESDVYYVRQVNQYLYALPFDKDADGFVVNAMFPVTEDVLHDAEGFEHQREWIEDCGDEIAGQIADLYMRRYNNSDPMHSMLAKVCCDFRALEKNL